MPKKEQEAEGTKPHTDTIRVWSSVIKKLRYLATHADKSLPDFVSEILDPICDKMMEGMVAELSQRTRKRH